MSEMCSCPSEAGSTVCEVRAQVDPTPRPLNVCPECDQAGKPVQGQTVKALLAVSLRTVRDADYFFCPTERCPVVYFTADGAQTFTTEQIRERVYQKERDADAVFVCYCFRHMVGDVQTASPHERAVILADINAGIQAGQCACDLRNPQGSCCLGNVRGLIKQQERWETANRV